ncbi:hypothetical protein [Caulobacter sp.]|uniref:hypothetical protein n=1 Tax=Caulobacter sp. TaxID=78 RepID=UPI001AFD0F92|nr:hypothetical protein [Caulobacter sp.]MBO9543069.1 hypothetical protein [Caulobacter sp.]
MKLKWMLPIGLFALSLATWIAFGIAVAMHVERKVLIAMAAFGALALEGVMWSTAAILGVSAFQARRQIWGRVRAVFQRA